MAAKGVFIWLMMLLAATVSVHATALPLDERTSYWLSEYTDYYEDLTGKLVLEEVTEQEFVHDYVTDNNFGFTTSAYWFRTTVIPSPKLLDDDDIRLYGVDAESGQLLFERHSGDLQPYDEREVSHLNFLFQLPLTERPVTLYVRVVTESSMQVPMVLQTSRKLIEEDQRTILITGLYYGLFVVIFLYNVIMYFYTKERTYLLYLFFISAFVTWQLTLNGIGQQYIWTDWSWMVEHGAPFWTALSAVAAILFSQHFLQTARFIPNIDTLLKVILLYSLFVVVMSIFSPYRLAILMGVGLAIVVPILLLVSGIIVWYKKFRPARFYVLGWSSFLLGTVIIALNKYGLFHGYLFFNHAQQLGSALEMIFLSWALADRIKLLQDEYVLKLNTLNVTLQNKVAASLEKEREKDKLLIKQSRLAAMGEMIEQIAHQWRQPLNTMALVMQDLFFKVKLNQFDERAFEKANEQINENLQYMSKTIDDFRNFHQMDKDTDTIPVEEVIEMAMTLNEASLKYSHTECVLHSERPHLAVIAKNELVQIFMNLIKNARDTIGERGIENGKIDISVEENDGAVFVTVEDNGGGISETVMDHLFEPYFTTKKQTRGTGLGLYMSRSIIEESMGGSLEAENGDHGARFIVKIPTKRSV
jgi:signal transduction histidine kinase